MQILRSKNLFKESFGPGLTSLAPMLFVLLVLTQSFCFCTAQADAAGFHRTVSLEWEPIANARLYEIQILRAIKPGEFEKPISFQSATTEWSGPLELGNYRLRVRAKDRRKVQGDWSQFTDFSVLVDDVQTVAPKSGELVKTEEQEKSEVTFEWKPVAGAIGYDLTILDNDGKSIVNENVKTTSFKTKLPVAKHYSWQIRALAEKGFDSENSSKDQFSLVAGKLEKPTITKQDTPYVRNLAWSKPENVEAFDYALVRYDGKTKTWVKVDQKKAATDTSRLFEQSWPGGDYRLQVRSVANLRQSSPMSELRFHVINGDRSPAAEEIATVRDSIDHTQGWFFLASYMMSAVNYSGVNSDHSPGNQLTLSFNGAIGGSGSLGTGFLSPDTPWGFETTGAYGGFILNSSVYNFTNLDVSGIYRNMIGTRGELRQLFGVFYKEMPNLSSDTSQNVTVGSVSTVGPHYGLEYWHSMGAKLGFEVNAHAYINAVSLSTPNGQPLASDLSYQVGLMGSYRLSPTMTGLAGWAYRKDSASYKANDNSINSTSIIGNYINLLLEWAL